MAYPFTFHQTFKPELHHISNLLSIEKGIFSKEELSHIYSIPTGKVSGKVEVNLLYAQAAGLLRFKKTNKKFKINRTKIGSVIYKDDSYLEEYCTKVLIHYMFCKLNSKLILWEMLFRTFHKGVKQFYSEDYSKYIGQKLLGKDNIKLAPLWGTYIGESPLLNIGILKFHDNELFSFGRVDILENLVYWYGYIILDFLKEIDSERLDFTLDEILKNGFSTIFGWKRDELKYILNLLENENIISTNKQFINYHIYVNRNQKDIVHNLNYI